MGSYSAVPMTVQTWPGPRNPCTRFPGAWRIAVIAGGTRTCETSRLKFCTPRRRASQTAMAFAGAVVSKPIAKKTTRRSGRPAHGLRRRHGTRPHISRRWRSELVELVHGLEEFEDATGLGLVEPGQRKADVHQDVVAGPNVGNVGEADLLGDTAEVHLAHQHVVLGKRRDHEARDTEAHQPASLPATASRAAAIASCPRQRPPSFGGTPWWR